MPSVALFEEQPQEYKDAVLPPACRKRVAVEAGRAEGWYRYVGLDGLALGLGHFGESAPAGKLAEKYGFTAPTVARKVRERFFG
jgi:transketolase